MPAPTAALSLVFTQSDECPHEPGNAGSSAEGSAKSGAQQVKSGAQGAAADAKSGAQQAGDKAQGSAQSAADSLKGGAQQVTMVLLHSWPLLVPEHRNAPQVPPAPTGAPTQHVC